MGWAFDPIVLPFVCSLLVTGGLSAYALRRPAGAARTFALLMALVTAMTACYVMELSSATLEAKTLWLKLKYFGFGPAPAVWFAFALQTTHRARWLDGPLRPALALWVATTWLVVFTNDRHHLMWTWIAVAPGQPESQAGHGPYFWAYALGAYGLIATSLVLYYQAHRVAPGFFRRQAALLALGGFAPLAGRMTEDLLGLDLVPKVDEVIFFFLLSGVLFALALFRYGALSIVPVAHSLVVQNIKAAIVVLDGLGRVVDLNPFARELFGPSAARSVGKPLGEALPGWPDLGADGEREVAVERGGAEFFFAVQASEIRDEGGRPAGRVVVLFDVTARKRAELALERLAHTDALTGLANRRRFFELAEVAMVDLGASGTAPAVLLLDVDHFKKVNDTYGHQAGDRVLQAVAAACRRVLRPDAILARYGGEELVCLLPADSLEGALGAAEALRREIEEGGVEFEGRSIRVTASLGVAVGRRGDPATLEAVIGRADEALYRSKGAGRNRATAWRPSSVPA